MNVLSYDQKKIITMKNNFFGIFADVSEQDEEYGLRFLWIRFAS